jgi:hypothetical protein
MEICSNQILFSLEIYVIVFGTNVGPNDILYVSSSYQFCTQHCHLLIPIHKNNVTVTPKSNAVSFVNL